MENGLVYEEIDVALYLTPPSPTDEDEVDPMVELAAVEREEAKRLAMATQDKSAQQLMKEDKVFSDADASTANDAAASPIAMEIDGVSEEAHATREDVTSHADREDTSISFDVSGDTSSSSATSDCISSGISSRISTDESDEIDSAKTDTDTDANVTVNENTDARTDANASTNAKTDAGTTTDIDADAIINTDADTNSNADADAIARNAAVDDGDDVECQWSGQAPPSTRDANVDAANALLVHACSCDAPRRCRNPHFGDLCLPMKRLLRSACWASHNRFWLPGRVAALVAKLLSYHSLHCDARSSGGGHCAVPLCAELTRAR